MQGLFLSPEPTVSVAYTEMHVGIASMDLASNCLKTVMIQNTCLEKTALQRKYPQELYCGPVQALGSAKAMENKVLNTLIPAHLLIKNFKSSHRV